jgi:hypothetical protein
LFSVPLRVWFLRLLGAFLDLRETLANFPSTKKGGGKKKIKKRNARKDEMLENELNL